MFPKATHIFKLSETARSDSKIEERCVHAGCATKFVDLRYPADYTQKVCTDLNRFGTIGAFVNVLHTTDAGPTEHIYAVTTAHVFRGVGETFFNGTNSLETNVSPVLVHCDKVLWRFTS